MPFAQLADLRLYYRMAGSGPRLLYIGGTGGDLRSKPNVLHTPLVERFTVLAYDQRGLGQSGRPPGAYSMADFADDAAGLLSALGWGPCLVLGYSFGGMVAQEMALRHRRLVRRLVLVGSSSGGRGEASYPLEQLASLPLKERARRLLELADLRLDRRWQEEHPEEFSQMLAQRQAELALGAQEAGRMEGLARQLAARQGHDTYDRLGGLTMPVLLVGGLHDGIAPPANQKALAAAIPGARLALFPGGHRAWEQNPQAWKRIFSFLLA